MLWRVRPMPTRHRRRSRAGDPTRHRSRRACPWWVHRPSLSRPHRRRRQRRRQTHSRSRVMSAGPHHLSTFPPRCFRRRCQRHGRSQCGQCRLPLLSIRRWKLPTRSRSTISSASGAGGRRKPKWCYPRHSRPATGRPGMAPTRCRRRATRAARPPRRWLRRMAMRRRKCLSRPAGASMRIRCWR